MGVTLYVGWSSVSRLFLSVQDDSSVDCRAAFQKVDFIFPEVYLHQQNTYGAFCVPYIHQVFSRPFVLQTQMSMLDWTMSPECWFSERGGCWDSNPVEGSEDGAGTEATLAELHWDITEQKPSMVFRSSVQEVEGAADNPLHMGHYHPSPPDQGSINWLKNWKRGWATPWKLSLSLLV